MMNHFLEPAPPHHAHHLSSYGLKMSPPIHSASQENVSNSMLSTMNVSNSDHNAVGISNNSSYQSSNYAPSAATTTPYPTYSRDYIRDRDYFSMTAQTANAPAPDPMIFPGIHHTHPMHDNQFTSYHQHQMRMGITSGSVGSSSQIPTASIPQSAGKNNNYKLFF